MHQARVLPVKREDRRQCWYLRMLAKPSRPAEAKPPQFVPCVVADIAIRREDLIEHIVVKAYQDTVLRLTNVDLIPIRAKLERRPIGFQGVFLRKLARP